MAKNTTKKTKKPSDEEQVASWMDNLDTALKTEIDLIRNIIKKSDKRIKERIKWNAPSYYHLEDIVTFGPRKANKILLVFHHPAVVRIKSEILEGDYKDRRLAWFSSADEIHAREKELIRIVKEIVKSIDSNSGKGG